MVKTMCLCSSIRQLADNSGECNTKIDASELTTHLAAIRFILTRSKPLARDVGYQVVPVNQRTSKILSAKPIDTERVNKICDLFNGDLAGFWSSSAVDVLHAELRRRLACVSIFLRSKVDLQNQNEDNWISPNISGLYQAAKMSELRYAGKKYIKIARKLGGMGSLFWLPLDIPSSTYERYLNMDDEEAFGHLQSVGSRAPNYDDFVQRMLTTLISDSTSKLSYYNLFTEHADILPRSDQLILLLCAFGGTGIPLALLKSVRVDQRRWGQDGEIHTTTAIEFGIHPELLTLFLDDEAMTHAGGHPEIMAHELEDGTPTWSISPQTMSKISDSLSPQTKEELENVALRLICFATPPCFEGNTDWPLPLKKAIWNLLNITSNKQKLATSLRSHVVEALLFFAERDFFLIRQIAVARARTLFRKSMPYYLHASLVLYESIIDRMDGRLDKSDAKIKSFMSNAPDTISHYESAVTSINYATSALRGRLHVSHIENKVQRYDSDVASSMYGWEGIQPLSSFEIEVTRRLQGTAAKFFQTIGDFEPAKASLEQHLWLNSATPIRPNTRMLITSKLAECHCELKEYEKSIGIIQSLLEDLQESQKKGRPFRRLLLALTEARIGQGNLDAAETLLQQLEDIEPPELDDTNDQLLHMRRLIDAARVVHDRLRFVDAVEAWKLTLKKMEQLPIFRAKHRWTAAVIHLSMAHAQLTIMDIEPGRLSWGTAVQMSRIERCEYVIPGLATLWLPKIVGAVNELTGWPFRMMLPGGKPDIAWEEK
ncbi:hypothetical protein EDB81DRAFT_697144 [Dactylonectria macrodidyma]|uniref:Uncharacterized protein n=1 Tax=Dactylonectria macrodidyma TaxID=307937 RepID=A0A9P9DZ09_9HYPO|nr:hypothetical protein EDB81DRAFT_697144 [Dactylonectria macrodidyma]